MSLAIILFCIATTAVSGQKCTDTVGSLRHDINTVSQGLTYIFAGYTINCSGIVVAWEFCYQISDALVSFYPGIWRIAEMPDNNTRCELIQSNNITYNASIQTNASIYSCQTVDLSITDQFTAPARSVVGLYSGTGPQLLHTNNDSSITTYKFNRNQTNVTTTGNSNDINYNIAIRVYLGEMHIKLWLYIFCVSIYVTTTSEWMDIILKSQIV